METRLAYALQQNLLKEMKLRQAIESTNKKVDDETRRDKPNSLTIGYTVIQKLPNFIKNLMEQNFQSLLSLTITNCDLRTFQNFPHLSSLKNLDASKNSLRGSFEFLIKNKNLQCIDISCNIISEVKRFEPLRYLRNVYVYAKDNPFEKKMGQFKDPKSNPLLQELKSYSIRLLSRPPNKKKCDLSVEVGSDDKLKIQEDQLNRKESGPERNQKEPSSQKNALARMLSPKPKISPDLDVQLGRHPQKLQPKLQKRQQLERKKKFTASLASFELQHLEQYLNFEEQQQINQDLQQEQNQQIVENEIQLDSSDEIVGLSSVQRPLRFHSRLINQLFSNMQARRVSRVTIQRDAQEDEEDSDNDNDDENIDEEEEQKEEDEELQEIDCSDEFEDDNQIQF